MADAYPWGSQSPQVRLSKLQRDLAKSQSSRESYLETHKTKLAEFDEKDRQLKADIRTCESIIEKERNEANSQALAKMLSKVANSGSVDLELLLSNPEALEKRLAALGSELKAPAQKASEKKKAPAGDGEAKASKPAEA